MCLPVKNQDLDSWKNKRKAMSTQKSIEINNEIDDAIDDDTKSRRSVTKTFKQIAMERLPS